MSAVCQPYVCRISAVYPLYISRLSAVYQPSVSRGTAVCQPYIRRMSAIPNLPICRLTIISKSTFAITIFLKPKKWLLLLTGWNICQKACSKSLQSRDIWKSPRRLPDARFALGRLQRFRVWKFGTKVPCIIIFSSSEPCRWIQVQTLALAAPAFL